MCIKIDKIGKQEVGIWCIQKHFPRYEVPIWSLWPNIRFLPSLVAEKNTTKNEHICSMCIKIHKVQRGSRNLMGPKTLPQYGIPIWSLWPHIRFLPSIVAEKNAMKNILDGRKDRRTEVKQYTPSPSGEQGYYYVFYESHPENNELVTNNKNALWILIFVLVDVQITATAFLISGRLGRGSGGLRLTLLD